MTSATVHLPGGGPVRRAGPGNADGTVTAGNTSGINDAAAAVVLASGSFVTGSGLVPMGKLVGYAHAGVEPRIEVNEAFAVQALAVVRELDLPPERTNPNGSGISLGHPIAAIFERV